VSTQNDQQFFGTALMVFGALVAITVLIIIAANIAGGGPDELHPEDVVRIENRLRAPATVITDPEMLVATRAAATRDPLPATAVNDRYCAACHANGILNAPVTGQKAAWEARLAEFGLEGLVDHAINGIRQMPARGGNPDLSDDEMRQTVQYMLEQSGL
jgi:cytochrome c5